MLRYNYRSGVSKQKGFRKTWIALPVVVLFGGGYLLVNILSPALQLPFDDPKDATAKKLVANQPTVNQNRLYIPQINLDVAIVEGDDESALTNGTWHRQPQNGNPVEGGNFVLSANRFSLGLTPAETRAKSPFYHVDQLSEGDQFYVDYAGTRYAYEVASVYAGDQNTSDIESRSDGAKLTLYTYDQTSRSVVEAKPVGTIAWVNGTAKLQARRN